MSRISIQEIASSIVKKHGLSAKDAEIFVTSLFDVINDGLQYENVVKIKGLGTFKVIDVRERESVNVNTGERFVIEGHGKITFTPDSVMQDLVNKPFALFKEVILKEGVNFEEIDSALNDEQSDEDRTEIVDISDDESNETESNDNIDLATEDTKTEDEVSETDININEDDNSIKQEEVAQQEPVEVEEVPEPSSVEVVQEEKPDENENEEVPEETTEPEKTEDNTIPVVSDEDENELYEESDSWVSRNKSLFFTIITVFVALLFLAVGYYWGHYLSGSNVVAKDVNGNAIADTLSNEKQAIENDSTEKSKSIIAKQANESNATKTEEGKKSNAEAMPLPLKNALAIVNTGAYRITGTDFTITVSKGDNIRKISKRYFGDGMVSYVQVHNGIVEVEEGMTVKIPKLEYKKKKK